VGTKKGAVRWIATNPQRLIEILLGFRGSLTLIGRQARRLVEGSGTTRADPRAALAEVLGAAAEDMR
jgi:hypothetical protein